MSDPAERASAAETLARVALETVRMRGELLAAVVARLEVLEARCSALEQSRGDDLLVPVLSRLEVLDARMAALEGRAERLEAAITPLPEVPRVKETREPDPD